MSKSSKHKKSKVPKLTEAEYAEYISSLKTDEESKLQVPMSAMNEEKTDLKLQSNE